MKGYRRFYPGGKILLWILAGVLLAAPAHGKTSHNPAPSFRIRFTERIARELQARGLEVPVTGRLYVIISRAADREPRLQVSVTGVPFWGVDVIGWRPGSDRVLKDTTPGLVGYPLKRFRDLPPGTYYVQAFLNIYTRFERADGHGVFLHLNSGAGQDLWRAPGNVYSRVQRFSWDGRRPMETVLELDRVLPPMEPIRKGEVLQQGNPRDTKHVKYIKIRSQRLSEFWGRPMYIGANVLVPHDYEKHPDKRYPVLYLQGHFPGRRGPFGFTDGETISPRARAFRDFWLSDKAPNLIIVTFRDANPYYDTSYSVNSANLGPYGDALTQELIPYLEKHFRIIPEPWARLLAGGSTGGWEALALQIFYPDLFGGTWAWCPDPVDFRYYQLINIYDDKNAYFVEYDWLKVERPSARRPDGQVRFTIRQEYRYEQALGLNSRSGGQWAVWEAVFGPVGPDGYPRPLWDPVTGVIDPEVAEYWREHYDLAHYLKTNWSKIGPKVTGKIHIAVGDMDSYYLEEAVYMLQKVLESLDHPPAKATFEYGRRKPHCWIGSSPYRPGQDLTPAEFVRMLGEFLESKLAQSDPESDPTHP